MLRIISLIAVLASCQSKVNNQFSETKLECGAIENQSAFWIPIVDEQGRKLTGENISARIASSGQSQPLQVSEKGCVGFEFDPGQGDELIIARDKPGELKGFIGPAKEVFDSYSSISMVSIQQKAFDFSCPVNGGLQNLFITSKAIQLNYKIDEALNHYEMKVYRGPEELLSPPKLLAGPYLLSLEQLQEGVNDIIIELRSKLSDRYTYQKVCKVEKDTINPRVTLTTKSESLELRPGQSLALTIEGANRVQYCFAELGQDRCNTYQNGDNILTAPAFGEWNLIAYAEDSAGNVSEPLNVPVTIREDDKYGRIENLLESAALHRSLGNQVEAAVSALEAESVRRSIFLADDQNIYERQTLNALFNARHKLTIRNRILDPSGGKRSRAFSLENGGYIFIRYSKTDAYIRSFSKTGEIKGSITVDNSLTTVQLLGDLLLIGTGPNEYSLLNSELEKVQSWVVPHKSMMMISEDLSTVVTITSNSLVLQQNGSGTELLKLGKGSSGNSYDKNVAIHPTGKRIYFADSTKVYVFNREGRLVASQDIAASANPTLSLSTTSSDSKDVLLLSGVGSVDRDIFIFQESTDGSMEVLFSHDAVEGPLFDNKFYLDSNYLYFRSALNLIRLDLGTYEKEKLRRPEDAYIWGYDDRISSIYLLSNSTKYQANSNFDEFSESSLKTGLPTNRNISISQLMEGRAFRVEDKDANTFIVVDRDFEKIFSGNLPSSEWNLALSSGLDFVLMYGIENQELVFEDLHAKRNISTRLSTSCVRSNSMSSVEHYIVFSDCNGRAFVYDSQARVVIFDQDDFSEDQSFSIIKGQKGNSPHLLTTADKKLSRWKIGREVSLEGTFLFDKSIKRLVSLAEDFHLVFLEAGGVFRFSNDLRQIEELTADFPGFRYLSSSSNGGVVFDFDPILQLVYISGTIKDMPVILTHQPGDSKLIRVEEYFPSTFAADLVNAGIESIDLDRDSEEVHLGFHFGTILTLDLVTKKGRQRPVTQSEVLFAIIPTADGFVGYSEDQTVVHYTGESFKYLSRCVGCFTIERYPEAGYVSSDGKNASLRDYAGNIVVMLENETDLKHLYYHAHNLLIAKSNSITQISLNHENLVKDVCEILKWYLVQQGSYEKLCT